MALDFKVKQIGDIHCDRFGLSPITVIAKCIHAKASWNDHGYDIFEIQYNFTLKIYNLDLTLFCHKNQFQCTEIY